MHLDITLAFKVCGVYLLIDTPILFFIMFQITNILFPKAIKC